VVNFDYDAVDAECDANNGTGDCSHVCALTYSGHICLCPDGYELAANRRTCQGKLSLLFHLNFS